MISNVKIAADNSVYYPTPAMLVDKMLSYVENIAEVRTILEPSAGAGDMVHHLIKYCLEEDRKVGIKKLGYRLVIDYVEIDQRLSTILKDRFKESFTEGEKKRYAELEKKRCAWNRDKKEYENLLTIKESAEYNRIRHKKELQQFACIRQVYDDFLNFNTYKQYDLIIMNPPFKNGDEHLLKAIDLQKRHGGQIVCLLNAETIRNPYSNKRKLLIKQFEELNAQIEFIADAFIGSDVERQTDVEIALVHINIGKPYKERNFFDELQEAEKVKLESSDSVDIVHADFIIQMIELYNYEIEETLKLVNMFNAIRPNINIRFNSKEYTQPIIDLTVGSREFNLEQYLKSVRSKYWAALFDKPEFMGMFTSNLQERYRGILDKMSGYDFNLYNIEIIKQDMLSGLDEGLTESILALFEKLSVEHAWYSECKNNIHYFNGWKTNTAHKINNKKVILPVNGYHSYSFKGEDLRLDKYKIKDNLTDIEKVLNYLDMGETENVDLYKTIEKAVKEGNTKKIPFKYFYATFYKKGTCHIEFRPECKKLIDKLNIYGSQKKGWLPPDYGKKSYSDMNDEERSVIDDFQGAEKYMEVCANSEYYLMNTSNLLQLQGITG